MGSGEKLKALKNIGWAVAVAWFFTLGFFISFMLIWAIGLHLWFVPAFSHVGDHALAARAAMTVMTLIVLVMSMAAFRFWGRSLFDDRKIPSAGYVAYAIFACIFLWVIFSNSETFPPSGWHI